MKDFLYIITSLCSFGLNREGGHISSYIIIIVIIHGGAAE